MFFLYPSAALYRYWKTKKIPFLTEPMTWLINDFSPKTFQRVTHKTPSCAIRDRVALLPRSCPHNNNNNFIRISMRTRRSPPRVYNIYFITRVFTTSVCKGFDQDTQAYKRCFESKHTRLARDFNFYFTKKKRNTGGGGGPKDVIIVRARACVYSLRGARLWCTRYTAVACTVRLPPHRWEEQSSRTCHAV